MKIPPLLALLSLVAALLLCTAPTSAAAAPSVSAASAGTKTIGQQTFAWGEVSESGVRDVWTEVQVDGAWSRSQSSRTSASGSYTLELTYGFTSEGAYRFRVGASTSAGTVYSSPFTFTRTPWTVGFADTKIAGHETNTWGTVSAAAGRQVYTEVRIGNTWSRSQTRTASSDGFFAIPLTYGITSAGDQTFRVGASTAMGTIVSEPFTLTRTPWTVSSAGEKPVGEATNVWDTLPIAAGRQVTTEVRTGSGWSQSQSRTANSSGFFAIPLTYGADTRGTYEFRVVANTSYGTMHSAPFTLTRTGSNEAGAQLVDAMNAYRASGATCDGVWQPPTHPLQWNDSLARAAQRHSNDLATNNIFSHYGSDGSSPAQRARDAGFNGSVGENVSAGSPTAPEVAARWINSSGHCQNVMRSKYTVAGAALATDHSSEWDWYWTAMFS